MGDDWRPRSTTERGATGRAALAGLVSAGAALAAGQLPTAVAGEAPDPVTAVGDVLVDRFAGSLKDLAVALFGRSDKVALLTGIVLVSLVAGAALGVVAGRRGTSAGVAGVAAFGVLGFVAQVGDGGAGLLLPVLALALGVGAGAASLALLVPWAAGRPPSVVPRTRTPADDPRTRAADRRSFLLAAGAVGASAALTGLGAWSLRGRSRIAAQRAALRLPEPVRSTPVPADTLQVPGLSPYITPNEDFYRIDTALVTPQVDATSWRLRVGGLVDRPYELTFDEVLALDLVEAPMTLACVSNEVGGDLVGNAVWLGVPLAQLLDRAGVQEAGTQVLGRSTDGFTAGFPTSLVGDGRVAMVAVGMNGEPLPADHGYPARLVVEGLYGYVSATKWLAEIELTAFDEVDGYWIPRGWSKLGPVRTQSRIDVPRHRATVDAGVVAVAGVAWAPSRGIDRVEVQVDEGPWQDATLGGTGDDGTWVQWLLRWDAEPGRHVLRCRATDGDGEVQTAQRRDPRPDGASGIHDVAVTVRAA